MKIRIKSLLVLSLIFLQKINAQTTIILQPDSLQGKDAYISDWYPGNYQNTNFGSVTDFDGIAWTASGTGYVSRSLIDFSLSAIPATATIIDAKLSLYHNPNSNQSGSIHQSLSGSNDSRLERITSAWNEFTVTWNTQPATTSQNAVFLPQSTSGTQDYLNINVTALVQDIFTMPSSSFGIMLRLNNESYYRSVVFCSSDYPNITKHPKLEITYLDSSTSCLNLILQPDSVNGKDAYISDWPTGNYQNTNFGTTSDNVAIAWTDGGVAYTGRGLFQFDLSGIPANATLISSELSLYNNPTSMQNGGQHASLSGSDDARLERIISPWNENTVTWNTQPATTGSNSVFLPQSITPNQDYTNINVLPLVSDMINNPSTSFGFMIRLNSEQAYRSLVFASSDHIDSLKHPKLEICYTLPTGIGQNWISDNNLFQINPNPFTDKITISYSLNKKTVVGYAIYDVSGRMVYFLSPYEKEPGKYSEVITKNIKNLESGIYYLRFSMGTKVINKKILKISFY